MKRSLSVGAFLIVAACLFGGCCSYVRVDSEVPPHALIEGERPLAAFYVQNISYQILGFIPFCSGVNWTEDDKPLDSANIWRMHFFCDNVSIDNNLLTLKRACKEVGSNRVTALSHNLNEDNLWSLLIVNRKVLKTSCFIMKPKGEQNVPGSATCPMPKLVGVHETEDK